MIPHFKHLKFLLYSLIGVFAAAVVTLLTLSFYIVSWFPGSYTLPADCAIVFGAAVHRGDQPGPGILRRVRTAARLYTQGDVQTIFFSGGKDRNDTESEASVMRRVAMLEGIDPEDIVIEERSTSTLENLQLTRSLIEENECETLLGISDRYHLARIAYLSRNLGLEHLQPFPADFVSSRYFESRSVVREGVGMVYYFVKQFLD